MTYTNEEKLSVLKLHLAIAFVDNNYSTEEEEFIGKLCNDFSIDMKQELLRLKKYQILKMTFLIFVEMN